MVLFTITLFAELVANDRPMIISLDDKFYFPVLIDYPEETFSADGFFAGYRLSV